MKAASDLIQTRKIFPHSDCKNTIVGDAMVMNLYHLTFKSTISVQTHPIPCPFPLVQLPPASQLKPLPSSKVSIGVVTI